MLSDAQLDRRCDVLARDRDAQETDDYPETDREHCCADCLCALTEDNEAVPVVGGDDIRCLSCEAEALAADVVLAEIRHDFTPSRSIGERERACDVIEMVLRQARSRVKRDAEALVGARS